MARLLDKPDFFQVLFQSIGLMKKSGVQLFAGFMCHFANNPFIGVLGL